MKKLIDFESVEKFNSRKLYKKVKELFNAYQHNISMFNLISKGSSANYSSERISNKTLSDPTYSNVVEREKYIKYIKNFESKLEVIKEEFTEEEKLIYEESIVKGSFDKSIYMDMKKDPHEYYTLKKSCYLKIAICFGIIKLKKIDMKLFKDENFLE